MELDWVESDPDNVESRLRDIEIRRMNRDRRKTLLQWAINHNEV